LEALEEWHEALEERRHGLLKTLRCAFHGELPQTAGREVMSFPTAKAMFLAYFQLFEQNWAQLFESAHALAHGVEAFMKGLCHRTETLDIN